VPALIVERAAVDDFDETHARFYQAASEQAALAERIAAVRVAKFFRFLVEAEGIQERAEDKTARAVVDFALLDCRLARPASRKLLVKLCGQRQAALQYIRRHRQMHILRQLSR